MKAQLKDQRGFTLLELMVAFAIMAMSLGLIYRAMGSSASNAGQLAARQQAVLLAESLLQTKDSVTPEGWNENGQSGNFSWQVASQLYGVLDNTPGRLKLHEISIIVSWPDGTKTRQVQTQTLLPQRLPGPGEKFP
jgi:general secretion pathway protein I